MRLSAKMMMVAIGCGLLYATGCAELSTRRIALSEYRDKMTAGWVGQCVGVGWGGPTEFKSCGAILPAEKMPKWEPKLVNQWGQDDLYVEMTFLRTLEQYGLEVSARQAGVDWANSGYKLWHANRFGRNNLRKGIAPPDSGHPRFNGHADDIDYQIEADFAGLVAPGLPNVVIGMGEKFGRLMNYGDGLYGGQFVGSMYAEAFFETDPLKIVEQGLKCIPRQSQYAECVRDVIAWYKQNPTDWEKTWGLINEKYHKNKAYRKASCGESSRPEFNIDAKINGAYIVMGLLYGQRDIEKTIVIATRCGQDSDCNPSSAAGVLFTTIGFAKLPKQYTEAIDQNGVFSHTAYTFPKLFAASEKVAREAVVKGGGRIEKDSSGRELFVIPRKPPVLSRFEQVWEPGPISNSRFTPEEQAKITTQPSE